MSRLAAIFDAVVASVREPAAATQPRSAMLAGRGLDARDEAALAALDDQTFFVYRKLVRRTLASAIRVELPRTSRLLGERFEADTEAFLSQGLSGSHYLRDVAFELVEHVSGIWPNDPNVPPFALDLARHELAAFRAASAPRPAGRAEPSLDLDAPCLFDESVSLSRYAYPVHELAEGEATLEPAETALLVYRDAEGESRFLKLSALAATIVEHALSGSTLGNAIKRSATEHGVPLTDALLAETAALLADLAERGVLLGRPAGPTTMVGA